jgi:large subunit ribosomal protein L32
MATPKKRTSPVRSGNRRRNIGLDLPAVTKDPNSGELMVKHRVSKVSGFYRGRQLKTVGKLTKKASK